MTFVGLYQAEATVKAEEALRHRLPYGALRCSFTTRDACQLAGDTARGVVDWPSQKSVSPATEVIMGMEADGLKLLPSRSLMRPAHPVEVTATAPRFATVTVDRSG